MAEESERQKRLNRTIERFMDRAKKSKDLDDPKRGRYNMRLPLYAALLLLFDFFRITEVDNMKGLAEDGRNFVLMADTAMNVSVNATEKRKAKQNWVASNQELATAIETLATLFDAEGVLFVDLHSTEVFPTRVYDSCKEVVKSFKESLFEDVAEGRISREMYVNYIGIADRIMSVDYPGPAQTYRRAGLAFVLLFGFYYISGEYDTEVLEPLREWWMKTYESICRS